jgi:1-acyl-sn-glycerol-3-phosphate acyltransferase
MRFRSTIFYAGLIPLTILFSIVSLLIIPTRRRTRYDIISLWAVCTIQWLKVTCNLTYEIKGVENIPKAAGVILCKHQSTWETIAMQLIFPRQSQVLKKELFYLPFFGWGLASLNPIAINRKLGNQAIKIILRLGVNRIKEGWWVLLFPEGTRVPHGSKGRYTQTGAALALEAKCPIVPVAHNAGAFWPKESFLKCPGVITVVIGEALPIDGKNRKQIMAEAEAWIENTCQTL